MFQTVANHSFGMTHPLGLPRPIEEGNFFGARIDYFVWNIMPVPTGCLAHFDTAVYRPYVKRLADWLQRMEFGWTGLAVTGIPPRYSLLREGAPASIPSDLRPTMSPPPRVPLQTVLAHFDREHANVRATQLVDVLTMVSEDLGPERFSAATADRAWIKDFLR